MAPNVRNCHFAPDVLNSVWTGDITYIATAEGWLYLIVVIDVFNREVVGWSIKPRMTTDLVLDALSMAWFRHLPNQGGAVSFRSRKPVFPSCLPGPLGHIRHVRIAVAQGQLLGQRPDREFLQQSQE
uniref:DDE-type integrase/transposase/recombinase n=1 Tax=Aromatoleum toluolicum TaxID=90060 RepID=A0ABX1NEJ1_9RHOO|nr:DDE-type integrase/transposase/recombinase [Aromatoleum toluolicum]